jgi:hypothetical protein
MTAPQPPGGPQQPVTLAELFTAACIAFGWEDGLSTEQSEKIARHYWPLAYYKAKGIPIGRQYDILGYLAARYARDFDVSDLTEELWEVIEASEQGHGYGRDGRWAHWQIGYIAIRAKRFIEQSDAEQERWAASFWASLHTSGFFRWYEGSLRNLRNAPRPGRQSGTRQPGTRKAGVRR